MKYGLIFVGLIVMSSVARDCLADNGAVALARPVNQITVDGDFSDWPSSLPWYPIAWGTAGDDPQDAADFDASFRVGYDKNALYVVVQIQDDSTLADASRDDGTGDWLRQDSCSVFLDVGHSGEEIPPSRYTRRADHSPRSGSGLAVDWSYQRSGTRHCYEWRFDLHRIHGPQVKLIPGLVVGLDFGICDRDTGDKGFSAISWGPFLRKWLSSEKLGDILLVSSEDKAGKVQGRLVGVDASSFKSHTVKLQHDTQSSPVTVVSDPQGEFEVALPAGEYRVFTMSGEESRRIRVEADATTPRLDIHVDPPIGTPPMVARKTVVTAGRGNRRELLHHFGPIDGIPDGLFRGVSQTSDGALWIASERVGLLRFDRKSFTYFNAPTDQSPLLIKSVTTDHRDNLWVTADQGDREGKLLRFDGESFVQLSPKHGLKQKKQQVLTDRDTGHWVRDHECIYRYDEGLFTKIFERKDGHPMLSMVVESASRLWVGTATGIIRLDAPDDTGSTELWHETHFDADDGLPGEGSVESHALLIDSSRQLWIGTDQGLFRYNGDSFERLTDGLGEVPVLALAESDDGTLWVGTDDDLVEFSDGKFTYIAKTGPVNDLFVDREQNVWISGRDLLRYDRRPMTPQNRTGSQLHETRKLLQTRDGALWVGTKQDVVHFKNDIATHYSEGDGFIGGNVTSLFEDSRGGVWIGTNRGVSHFDGQRFASSTFHDDPGIPIVNAIAEDTNGDIWLGMPGGVAIYDQEPMREHDGQDIPDTDTTTLTGHISSLSTMDGLPSNEVNALLGVADGAVWVATQLGVCRLRDDDVEQFSVPKKIVCFLKDDSGGLWAGGDGLYHFDGTRWKQISIDGKALVTGLTQDPTGRLWMATDMGLKVYDGFAVQTLLHFDGENGWCSDVSWDNRNHCVHLTSGLLKTYHPRATPSPIAITHVSADKQYESIGDVRFGSSQPFLRFAFHGTSFKTRADAMLYRYRLRGFNDEWKLTKNTQATYGRLPPGDYTFEVTAIDRDLSHSESPAIVQVHVDREYRQAAMWFGLVCGVITSVFLAMTVIKRNRGIRQLNVELDQRVKDRTSKLETETAENKKRHEQLLQTQKLDAVGTMASGIAHDFNNSLAAIMGFAELAKANPSGSDEFIEYILTASRNAAGTAKSLLTFSQNSTEEKVPQDIIRLVRDSSDFLRKILPTSIKLSSALQDSTTTWCSIDTVQIQQVLLNIAMNARDALPDGGEISISADEHPTRKDFVRLAIADNGTGMPDEVLKRIFDPFFMTKSRGQGTGLGMAIVHGIVEDHGGTIEIESSAGTGTTVSIVLPRCHPVESESEPVEPPEPVVEGRGETILVAEDNPEVQAMIETQLRSAGFDVLTADDGQQALNLLRTHAAKVRLALLDIDLPEIDGLTCLKQIALQYPRVSAIMMSGLSSVEPTQLDTPFLRKPFDRKQLLSMINGALPTGTATQANGVLVVDDNDIVRRTTEALLTSYDFDVYLANSGAEAVSQLRENLDLISTVWLDWNMPQSDPTSILKELRRISPTVRVLVVSGDLSLHAHDIQAKGFSRLLRKPFSCEELVEAVT